MTSEFPLEVVILCGGRGTRLQSVLPDQPKAMAPIGETPFLEFLLEHLVQEGIQRVILCLGYKASVIRNHFKHYKKVELVFSEEKTPLGTAGALKHVEPFIKKFPVLVLNGDTYCSCNLLDFFKFHLANKGVASLAVTALGLGSRNDGGNIGLSSDWKIMSFEEKLSNAQTGYLSAGLYILEKTVWQNIPLNEASLEQDIFPKLTAQGMHAYLVKEPQYDIGTPQRLEAFRNFQLS